MLVDKLNNKQVDKLAKLFCFQRKNICLTP